VIPSPTEEIRAIRRELAARFGNDLHRIAEETRRRQRDSGKEYISLPKRPPQAHDTTNHAIHRGRGDDAMGNPESSSAAR
jgi:hypothetical protein